MTFNPETVYNELHPYFQKRVQRHEPLARHAAFGVGGPADVWISLASQEELLDLVRLCAQEHWPLLVVGNGTNILFADAAARRGWRKLAPLSARTRPVGLERTRIRNRHPRNIGWGRDQ